MLRFISRLAIRCTFYWKVGNSLHIFCQVGNSLHIYRKLAIHCIFIGSWQFIAYLLEVGNSFHIYWQVGNSLQIYWQVGNSLHIYWQVGNSACVGSLYLGCLNTSVDSITYGRVMLTVRVPMPSCFSERWMQLLVHRSLRWFRTIINHLATRVPDPCSPPRESETPGT